ncbi:hypothetical protein SO802_019093 [Lithocarpus litseifolius]|uniref:Gnk2-homologous domain-containing protein n=1 Tax=Lithocarpus litseifolius TaxID=425828 RepID=A0AAW2CR41_9ROSI
MKPLTQVLLLVLEVMVIGQDRTYGLALCPGDTSVTDCMSCIADVTSKILTLCPNTRGVVMWNKFCMLKFFDKDFFGQIENQTRHKIMDSQNAKDPVKFGQKTEDLLSKLARIAFVKQRMYGRSTIKFAESKQLYLLAQCTRDITSIDCKRCLRNSISQLPNCCAGKKWATVYSGSCIVGYQTF